MMIMKVFPMLKAIEIHNIACVATGPKSSRSCCFPGFPVLENAGFGVHIRDGTPTQNSVSPVVIRADRIRKPTYY